VHVPEGVFAGNLDRDKKRALGALFILKRDESVFFRRKLLSCGWR